MYLCWPFPSLRAREIEFILRIWHDRDKTQANSKRFVQSVSSSHSCRSCCAQQEQHANARIPSGHPQEATYYPHGCHQSACHTHKQADRLEVVLWPCRVIASDTFSAGGVHCNALFTTAELDAKAESHPDPKNQSANSISSEISRCDITPSTHAHTHTAGRKRR